MSQLIAARISRREALRSLVRSGGTVLAASLLVACGQAPASPAAPSPTGAGSAPSPASASLSTPAPSPAATSASAPAATPTPAAQSAPAAAASTPQPPKLTTTIPPLAKEAEGIKYTNVPSLSYAGEITFAAWQYTPQTPTIDHPKPPSYLNRIIAEYQKLHPKITIKLIPPDVQANSADYGVWLRTQLAGAQAPNIFWQQANYVNSTLPKGTVVDLRPWLDKPDPYVASGPGSAKWRDLFTDWVIEWSTAPDGSINQVNGDIVSTSFFYNQDQFAKAGLDPEKTPTTWEEVTSLQVALKGKGIVPMTMSVGPKEYRWTWYTREAATMFYGDKFDQLSVDGGQYQLSLLSQAVAFEKGELSPDQPQYREIWRIFQDWTKYWRQGWLADIDHYRTWVNGDVAMMWDGSWSVAAALADPLIKFKWGTFRTPKFTKQTSQYATGQDPPAWGSGGPNASFQYSIATKQASGTMTPDKTEAAVDFLRFLTVPWNAGPMVNDLGSYIPTIKGTESVGPLKSIAKGIDVPSKVVFIPITIDSQETELYDRELQSFLGDRETIDQFLAKVKTITSDAIQRTAKRAHWDLAKYGVK